MNDIFTVAGIAVVSVGIIIILKQYRPEFAFGAALAFGIIIMLSIIDSFDSIIKKVSELADITNIDSNHFGILLRCLGICLVSKTASEICQDCGQSSVASKVDFAGKIFIILSSFPLFTSIIEIIKSLIVI